MEKEEKNMIKILSYVSKINKTKKDIKKLSLELMKNVKIYFNEEECNIKYEEYYFNGLLPPKEIEFKDILSSSFKLSWKIDDNKLNINKNQIKFQVEIKKENENFKKVYEGNEMNCLIENLNKNTNYEIRICLIYNNITTKWSEIKKIKTTIDSIILLNSKKYEEFYKKLIEWTGYKNMELLYRGSRDGMTSNAFHNKCNNQTPTLCLFKSTKGYIFGGYTPYTWCNYGGHRSNSNSFIFTLTNIHNIPPTKFLNSNSNYSIYDDSNYGPTFGGGSDIGIFYNGNNNNYNYSYFPHSYEDSLGKGKSIFTGDLNNNNQKFTLEEIEVFKCFN